MKIIEVGNVSKSFSIPSVRRDTLREHVLDLFRPRPVERIRVLDAVTFSVAAGETLGIMGRNGSGKSTLLKILSGIYQPDAGAVTVRAPVTPILELGVGWDPNLTAIDNVYLLGSVMGLSLREIRHSLDEILAFAELERFANLELRHYSSGMAARLLTPSRSRPYGLDTRRSTMPCSIGGATTRCVSLRSGSARCCRAFIRRCWGSHWRNIGRAAR